MTNDGGLLTVLQAANEVSNELLFLGKSREAKNKRQRDDAIIDEHHQSHVTENISSASNTTATAGIRRKPSRSLSEVSNGNTNTNQPTKMNLGQHTSDELKQAVAPLLASLEKLDAAALLSLNPSNDKGGARLKEGLTVPPIHDRISPSYQGDGETQIVRYIHVKEAPNKYSLGVFVFPPNAEIPLHDHPNMVVLSRVLYGELKVKSFDVIPAPRVGQQQDSEEAEVPSVDPKNQDAGPKAEESEAKSKTSLRSSFTLLKDFVSRAMSPFQTDQDRMQVDTDSDISAVDGVLLAQENESPLGVEKKQDPDEDVPVKILSAPHVTCLYPHEGNCHSFVAGPYGAAVLDVLLPPYADNERDCTFYDADEVDSFHHHPAAEKNGNGKRARSYTLTPIDQPDNFHCLSGTYGRFGACRNFGQDVVEKESRVNLPACSLS